MPSARLAHRGVRGAAPYRALINLAYRWRIPGVTRIPVRGGRHWLQSSDPVRYDPMSDSDLIDLCLSHGRDEASPDLASLGPKDHRNACKARGAADRRQTHTSSLKPSAGGSICRTGHETTRP